MAGQYRVTCHKPDNLDADRRIQGLGGFGTSQWYLTIDQLISQIESGEKFWCVDTKGNSVWINVHIRNSRKYLKTDSDGIEPNNLLALPHCP